MWSYKVINKSLFLSIHFYFFYFNCWPMLEPQLYRLLWIFTVSYIKGPLMSEKPQPFTHFSIRLSTCSNTSDLQMSGWRSMKLSRVQWGYPRWNGGMWSVPEEIREYGWGKRHYLWIGMDVARLGYDIGPLWVALSCLHCSYTHCLCFFPALSIYN